MIGRRLQALGRLKTGQMNPTEAAYGAELELRKRAGEIAWFKFEGVKLRLADNTFLTVDFFVMLADGRLQAHEVKGSRSIVQDDSWAKTKIAADMYPFEFFMAYSRRKRDGGGFEVVAV